MPPEITAETPDCSLLRALTFDVLGLIKVVEARTKQGGGLAVVERWGYPDPSKCVLAVSTNDSEIDPLLAVARKNGLIEVLRPLTGDLRVSTPHGSYGDQHLEDDNVVGLHIFKRTGMASSIRALARHPELPVLASCGLDSYLRLWDVKSRKLLSAVFLKQPLSNVVFDSHFKDEAAVSLEKISISDGEVEEPAQSLQETDMGIPSAMPSRDPGDLEKSYLQEILRKYLNQAYVI